MIRTGAHRAFQRSFTNSSVAVPRVGQRIARFTSKPSFVDTNAFSLRQKSLALTTYRSNTALIRSYASGAAPGTTRSAEQEAALRSSTLQTSPLVSADSSTHPVFGEVGMQEKEDDTDMMAGIRHDVKIIKETFALDTVPREALRIGLAGVIPYLATSAATVFCAFEMNASVKHGTGYLLSEESAEALLHVLEPLQVGYGAVILSCLGTIHWGLEWAGYGGSGGYRRYAIGVLAPAVAWPTIFLPVEYALVSQFLAFNLLYAVDSNATVRGWTPPWYSSYRFILTFVVGASIVVSLIGRGQIQDRIGRLPTATDRFRELQKVGLVKGQATGKDEQEGEFAEEEEE